MTQKFYLLKRLTLAPTFQDLMSDENWWEMHTMSLSSPGWQALITNKNKTKPTQAKNCSLPLWGWKRQRISFHFSQHIAILPEQQWYMQEWGFWSPRSHRMDSDEANQHPPWWLPNIQQPNTAMWKRLTAAREQAYNLIQEKYRNFGSFCWFQSRKFSMMRS